MNVNMCGLLHNFTSNKEIMWGGIKSKALNIQPLREGGSACTTNLSLSIPYMYAPGAEV